MEDYREKIEKLPLERLENLVTAYQKTIKQLEDHYREASAVAMLKIAEYTKAEIDKKKAELKEIESIIAGRQSEKNT